MADVEVLPLPDWGGAQIIPDNLIRDYARANMEPLIAEIETLREEVRRLNFEVDAAAIYGDDRDAHYLQAEARAERLTEALREWWSAHRPVGWTEDHHRVCPYVNLATDTDKALADALLREQEEGK